MVDIYRNIIEDLIDIELRTMDQARRTPQGVDITIHVTEDRAIAHLIRRWRSNAQLTQVEMSELFMCSKRNIENWEQEKSLLPRWSAFLVLEKLIRYTEALFEENGQITMNGLKSDRNKNRPEGSWAVIATYDSEEEPFLATYTSMAEAIIDGIEMIYEADDITKTDIEIAYIIHNHVDDDSIISPVYTDRRGINYENFDSAIL